MTNHVISLQDLRSLSNLRLSDNQLKSIPAGVFDPTDHPTSLHLNLISNPLVCDDMCWVINAYEEWINKLEGTCTSSSSLQNHDLNELSMDDLNCKY